MEKEKSNPIKTVLTITVGFVVVFLITGWKWAIIVSLVIGLIGLFSIYLSKKIDFLWMKLAWLLSLVVPNIILGIVFYLILFPVSVLSKLYRKKDQLKLSNKLKSTYTVTNKSFDKKSFEHPW